jgi:hypothetical protein
LTRDGQRAAILHLNGNYKPRPPLMPQKVNPCAQAEDGAEKVGGWLRLKHFSI